MKMIDHFFFQSFLSVQSNAKVMHYFCINFTIFLMNIAILHGRKLLMHYRTLPNNINEYFNALFLQYLTKGLPAANQIPQKSRYYCTLKIPIFCS